MPLGAFGLLLGGYISGAFLGGLVAAFIKPIYATRNAISVGVIVLFGALMNFVNLPHPTWFVAATLCCFVPFAWLGSWVASRFAQ